MITEPNAALLDRARTQVGLSLDELWVAYFELGGKADPVEFEGFFYRLLKLDSYQYNVVAQALNEQFMARGEDHPVPYVEDGSQSG